MILELRIEIGDGDGDGVGLQKEEVSRRKDLAGKRIQSEKSIIKKMLESSSDDDEPSRIGWTKEVSNA